MKILFFTFSDSFTDILCSDSLQRNGTAGRSDASVRFNIDCSSHGIHGTEYWRKRVRHMDGQSKRCRICRRNNTVADDIVRGVSGQSIQNVGLFTALVVVLVSQIRFRSNAYIYLWFPEM